jgi:DNA-binding beta-propeller fold protein YncE
LWISAVVSWALVGVIALASAGTAVAADTIYWGNFDGDTIGFANLDGSGDGGQLVTSGATLDGPDGLAIDSPTGRLYWANFGATGNGTTISFANLGGGGGGVLSAPGATITAPAGPAIDPVVGKIYWTNGDNTISFANLDGTGGGQLSTAGATVNGPSDVAIDPAGGKIYWANAGTGTIDFANLDGSGGGGQLNTTGATISFPNGLAIDDAAGRIYWANGGGGTQPVSFANLNGSGGADLNAASNGNGAFGLALDPVSGKLYYGEGDAIFSTNTSGGGGGQLNTGSAPLDTPGFPVLLKTPTGTGAPAVTGGAQPGSTLSCSTGSWATDLVGAFLYQAPQSFGYSWSRDGSTIPGATSNTLVASSPGEYACQVTAQNHAGAATQTSAPHTISAAALPAATTGAASNLTHTSATLHGTVNPDGSATTYFFQYGTSIAYGKQTSSQNGGADTTTHPASALITGLSPGTSYHFRIVAHNAAGTIDGADKTFTTPDRPLKLAASPRRARAGMRACFTFRATSTGHSVAGAAVRFAHHTTRTSRSGKATICLTLRGGTYHATATKAGFSHARASVTIARRKRPTPSFTG